MLDRRRALQSRTLNKQTISEKIPSLFAFLASALCMKSAVLTCGFIQTSCEKMKMKNIPGASRSDKQRESFHAAEFPT
jgi:hypothetical protein